MKHRKYQKEMYLIIFIIHFYFQLGNSRIDSLENQFQTQKSLTSQQINNENTPDKNDLYINTISPDDQEIKNITLKNQVKKIQSAYRNYKTRNKSNPDLITDINDNIILFFLKVLQINIPFIQKIQYKIIHHVAYGFMEKLNAY